MKDKAKYSKYSKIFKFHGIKKCSPNGINLTPVLNELGAKCWEYTNKAGLPGTGLADQHGDPPSNRGTARQDTTHAHSP